MNRNEARAYFVACGLSYERITLARLKRLSVLLNEKFAQRQKMALLGERPYWGRVNDAKYFKGRYRADGTVIGAYLTARGSHFNCREVISFNEDGFIGFCGDSDEKNTQPVIAAFVEWCDWCCGKGAQDD